MKKTKNVDEDDIRMRQITQYNLNHVWMIRESIANISKIGIHSFTIEVLRDWVMEHFHQKIDVKEVAEILYYIENTDRMIQMKIWFENEQQKPVIVDVLNQIPRDISFDKCYPLFFITKEYEEYCISSKVKK